jgi:acyl-CoA thioesterase FadM
VVAIDPLERRPVPVPYDFRVAVMEFEPVVEA